MIEDFHFYVPRVFASNWKVQCTSVQIFHSGGIRVYSSEGACALSCEVQSRLMPFIDEWTNERAYDSRCILFCFRFFYKFVFLNFFASYIGRVQDRLKVHQVSSWVEWLIVSRYNVSRASWGFFFSIDLRVENTSLL